jgi:hypothetical protein
MSHNILYRRLSFAPDFSLSWHEKMANLRPNNRKAARWLLDTAPEDAQFWCSTLAIESRHVQNLVEAANNAGFVVDWTRPEGEHYSARTTPNVWRFTPEFRG